MGRLYHKKYRGRGCGFLKSDGGCFGYGNSHNGYGNFVGGWGVFCYEKFKSGGRVCNTLCIRVRSPLIEKRGVGSPDRDYTVIT
jgi:hypothetical protein